MRSLVRLSLALIRNNLTKIFAMLNNTGFPWRQPCICTLIDRGQRPITARVVFTSLYKTPWLHAARLPFLRGCLHDTGATFAPERVHSGSLSWLYICLHDTTTKFLAKRGAERRAARFIISSRAKRACITQASQGQRDFLLAINLSSLVGVRLDVIQSSDVKAHYRFRGNRLPSTTKLWVLFFHLWIITMFTVGESPSNISGI